MKRRKSSSIVLFVIVGILFLGFENSNKAVEQIKIELKLPLKFPKPHYDFKNNPITTAGFELGRKLFYDEILSRDQTVSCHSCHQSIAAFAHIDHKLSHGIDSKIGTRNVPALQNLIWKDAFMWDGGINHIEVQPINPITSKIEMDETLENVVHKLKKDSTYREMFKKAFHDTTINTKRILLALTQFTGMMISCNSRYDRYIAGSDTFSKQEKNGLKLFRSKCATCHREPLFTDNSYRNNGIGIDSTLNDKGRGMITLNPSDDYKFKVPSLRNIERTYPYMHDGRYRKLYDVMKHYGNQALHTSNAERELQKIGILTDKERVDIISFLLTLTDHSFINDQQFSDPNRK